MKATKVVTVSEMRVNGKTMLFNLKVGDRFYYSEDLKQNIHEVTEVRYTYPGSNKVFFIILDEYNKGYKNHNVHLI